MEKQVYSQLVADKCKDLFGEEILVELSRPEEQFGDFSTNVAMRLAKKVGKPPREIAEQISASLKDSNKFSDVSIAGPGFINIRLNDGAIYSALGGKLQKRNDKLLLEYSCPNPFKELHVGHLYQTVFGDSLARVYERLGTRVYRVNFGGDVGLHVAKSLWGMINDLGGEDPSKLENIPVEQHASWLAKVYVAGASAYESSEQSKKEIENLNKQIYELHKSGDKESDFARLYWQTRTWSYEYFKQFYSDVSVTPFDKFIGESETAEAGLEIVNKNTPEVFEKSDGAVILSKERSGLHARVFITREGLPTYETKDLGVIKLESEQFEYDKRIIITGNDQREYMQVVFAALSLVDPELGGKQTSLTHGTVKFSDGQKMSSRLGNVTRAVDVLAAANESVKADNPELAQQIALGAVKYTFLKNSIGGDISFDLGQSISLEGNSGPYLQYALVRARSILAKLEHSNIEGKPKVDGLDEHERRLASWLTRFGEELQACVDDSSVHHLCGYLYGLSQVFNQFYENSRVIGDTRADIRTVLVAEYERVLSDGLDLLGMPKPEKM